MPTFRPPVFSKVLNPKSGAQESCYIFNVDFAPEEHRLSYIVDSQHDITLQLLQKLVIENVTWWNSFIRTFLESSAKLFSKPYTIEQINKVTKHTLDGSINNHFPANVMFLPKSIQIIGGIFTVHWGYIVETVSIDIPDLEESESNTQLNDSLPVLNKQTGTDEIEELNMDELPVNKNATDDDSLELESPTKMYDRQLVKEARLKAKLAMYKAQRQMAQFYQKYGNDVSDSEDDTDEDEEDIEDSEIDDYKKIQL